MRDSIFYSACRTVVVSMCIVFGLCLGFLLVIATLGLLSGGSTHTKLTTVHTEEIMPNANGQREVLGDKVPVILQIDIEGVIGVDTLTEQTIRQQLIESQEGHFKDNRVKGILLRVNTPGGTVSDADGIFRALQEYKKKYAIPIYAYVDGLCASGGMYVALAADKIYSSDISLIGSVGVIAPTFMNVTKLLDKVGIEALTISAGKDKDALNPLRPWKPGEEANYEHIIGYYYDHFVHLVTTYRPRIDPTALVKEYGAHIFPAPQALERGFIDGSGLSLADTLRVLLQEAQIPDTRYQVVRLENKQWWKSLFSEEARSVFRGKITHKLSFSPQLDLLLQSHYLYMYQP